MFQKKFETFCADVTNSLLHDQSDTSHAVSQLELIFKRKTGGSDGGSDVGDLGTLFGG